MNEALHSYLSHYSIVMYFLSIDKYHNYWLPLLYTIAESQKKVSFFFPVPEAQLPARIFFFKFMQIPKYPLIVMYYPAFFALSLK